MDKRYVWKYTEKNKKQVIMSFYKILIRTLNLTAKKYRKAQDIDYNERKNFLIQELREDVSAG